MSARLHLACTADASYRGHLAAMLHSALTSPTATPLHVHLLHAPPLPAGWRRRLTAMVRRHGGEIDFHAVPAERVAALPTNGFGDVALWHPVLLADLLPGRDRVLYLDADTLVLDALDALWATDLRGGTVAAVTNVFFLAEHAERVAALGLEPERYFNSGVLLLDLARWRATGATEAVFDLARRRGPELLWPDQDALNLVLGAERAELAPRWNAMNSVMRFAWAQDVFGAEAVEEARRRPAIRHFEGPGPNKPWHLLCDHPHRERYFAHRRRTPWPVVRRTGVTAGNLVRRVRA